MSRCRRCPIYAQSWSAPEGNNAYTSQRLIAQQQSSSSSQDDRQQRKAPRFFARQRPALVPHTVPKNDGASYSATTTSNLNAAQITSQPCYSRSGQSVWQRPSVVTSETVTQSIKHHHHHQHQKELPSPRSRPAAQESSQRRRRSRDEASATASNHEPERDAASFGFRKEGRVLPRASTGLEREGRSD